MSFFDIESVLTQRFQDTFVPAYPDMPVDYPASKVPEPTEGKLVRVRFRHVTTNWAAVGGSRKRRWGSMLIQMRFPSGEGPGDLLLMADAVAGFFERYSSGGVKIHAPPSFGGTDESGGFITGVVDVPFRADYSG